jgi:hypothetical protein
MAGLTSWKRETPLLALCPQTQREREIRERSYRPFSRFFPVLPRNGREVPGKVHGSSRLFPVRRNGRGEDARPATNAP